MTHEAPHDALRLMTRLSRRRLPLWRWVLLEIVAMLVELLD